MITATIDSPTRREPRLLGQTVVVIGGSAGMGLETARLAHAEGADLILTARDLGRRQRVGLELGASITAFDATDFQPVRQALESMLAQQEPFSGIVIDGRWDV